MADDMANDTENELPVVNLAQFQIDTMRKFGDSIALVGDFKIKGLVLIADYEN